MRQDASFPAAVRGRHALTAWAVAALICCAGPSAVGQPVAGTDAPPCRTEQDGTGALCAELCWHQAARFYDLGLDCCLADARAPAQRRD